MNSIKMTVGLAVLGAFGSVSAGQAVYGSATQRLDADINFSDFFGADYSIEFLMELPSAEDFDDLIDHVAGNPGGYPELHVITALTTDFEPDGFSGFGSAMMSSNVDAGGTEYSVDARTGAYVQTSITIAAPTFARIEAARSFDMGYNFTEAYAGFVRSNGGYPQIGYDDIGLKADGDSFAGVLPADTYGIFAYAAIGGFDEDFRGLESAMGEWTLTVQLGCNAADCDVSGTLNLDDIDCFVGEYLAGSLAADCDGSGVLNIDDIDCFASAFLAGCP